jgi:CheY-like chemotaxis protein
MIPTNKNRILVVDDDADILSLTGYIFESEGYKVDLMANGLDAIQFLRGAVKELPAFILLDLMMPNMDGAGFIQEMMKEPDLASIPIVVMSASGEREVNKKGLGDRMFIRKPVSLDTLIEVAKLYCAPANT